MSGRDKARLATDGNGNAIQGALCPREGGSQNVSFGVASAASLIISNAEVVRLIATTDCHVRFGTFAAVAAVATDTLLKANLAEYFTLRGNAYIAAIRDTADGILNISIMD